MKTDQRIESTRRRIAPHGLGIGYGLMLAPLLYRHLRLRQAIDLYWDIAVMFFGGTPYVSYSLFSQGAAHENKITQSFKWSIPTILLTTVAVRYLIGEITSLADVKLTAISAAVGLTCVTLRFFLANRRWERGIEAH